MANVKSRIPEYDSSWDAETLVRYQEIMSNKKRFAAAKKEASRKADNYERSSKLARAASKSK